ncbi:ATP-binding protein [Paenibacillus spongiae]|uniref:histidine kinase n=1 Tax=Paenibacillus spongiae TaxID=2909671 RepID=A0ABY5SBD2_9BACL|nr:ATP-binding protein [Paenibacillus spongiae]UVI30845.1 ATP-binding protein [Paenibacillus spongiae]
MDELILSDKWMFLLLAIAINLFASFTMFNMIGHPKISRSFRNYWLFNGAVVYGLGLWVSRFIIELATDNMIIMDWTSVVKLVAAAVTAYFAFRSLRMENFRSLRIIMSGLLLAGGTCGLNFASLLGNQIQAYDFKPGIALTAFMVSFLGSIGAFYLYESRRGHYLLLSGLTLGFVGIFVQMTGIAAVTITYDVVLTADRLNEYMGLLAIVLGVATSVIFAFSLIARFVDQRFSAMNERYRLLVENSIDTIAIIRDGRWEYVNRSGIALFEASGEGDLINQSIYHFLQPRCHQEMKRILQVTDRDVQPAPVELGWYSVKGRPFPTEVVLTWARLHGQPALQVIIRDISERKKNEELLINSEKLSVAGQLAAGIAHEIRNPLTSLKGFLQLIASGRQNNKNYFDIMKSELTRIESIVSELLMLSKPQVYELSYRDLRHVMGETVTLLEAQALLHSIELEIRYGEEPLWVHGVENQLKQVFINVLKNAIEAMGDGGSIQIDCVREDADVIIRIQDYGPGIPREQMAKIGQPFYTTKDKGTGLGLMVSYKIVDNHQGNVSVNSTLGSGTTFEISLPYNSPEESPVEGSSNKVTPIHRS